MARRVTGGRRTSPASIRIQRIELDLPQKELLRRIGEAIAHQVRQNITLRQDWSGRSFRHGITLYRTGRLWREIAYRSDTNEVSASRTRRADVSKDIKSSHGLLERLSDPAAMGDRRADPMGRHAPAKRAKDVLAITRRIVRAMLKARQVRVKVRR